MNKDKNNEIEILRSIVRQGRNVYSSYGVMATPPDHDMYTEDADILRASWISATDNYLRSINKKIRIIK